MKSKKEIFENQSQEQREEDFKEVLLFFLFCSSGITIAGLILIYIGG